MAIRVFGIKPHHAGFGQFQCDVEGTDYPQFDSAEEYAAGVTSENTSVERYLTDADAVDGDEDSERLAEAIRTATGAVQGGHGKIVAFLIGDEIQLESVDVIS